jgi:hypothetical protein
VIWFLRGHIAGVTLNPQSVGPGVFCQGLLPLAGKNSFKVLVTHPHPFPSAVPLIGVHADDSYVCYLFGCNVLLHCTGVRTQTNQ